MSTQETNLKAIADAIREKDGTTASIPANTFPDRIRAIPSGGGLPDDVYAVTLTADPPEGGTVSGGGYASAGMTCNINAVAANRYVFRCWKENEETVCTGPSYSFPVSYDRSLIASFSLLQFVSGEDWFETLLPSSAGWSSIAYGNGTFVAVSSNLGKAAYSPDGINWTETTIPKRQWTSVAYGNGKFVAVYYGGSQVAYSTNNGKTWTEKSSALPVGAQWTQITYGNGTFVAVATNSNYNSDYAAYSTDGINWTEATLPVRSDWSDVVYGNGTFVAASGSHYKQNVAYSKNNGKTWTKTSWPSGEGGYSLAFGNGKFVGISSKGDKAVYSTNGSYWVETTFPLSASWSDVTYGDGKFVAVAYKSNQAAYSVDGITWESATLLSSGNWYSIACGDGTFVAVARDSDKATYSFTKIEDAV